MDAQSALKLLRDRRKQLRISQKKVAPVFGLTEKAGRIEVGKWENDHAVPSRHHRDSMLYYLLDILMFRDDPQLFEDVWDALCVHWDWHPHLTAAERALFETPQDNLIDGESHTMSDDLHDLNSDHDQRGHAGSGASREAARPQVRFRDRFAMRRWSVLVLVVLGIGGGGLWWLMTSGKNPIAVASPSCDPDLLARQHTAREQSLTLSQPLLASTDVLTDPVPRQHQAIDLFTDTYRWTTIMSDTFDINCYGWPLSDTYTVDDFANHRIQMRDGVLVVDMESHTPNGAMIWTMPDTMPKVADLYLGVDITCIECDLDTSPGLMFRAEGPLNAESFYFVRYLFDQTVIVAKQPASAPGERLIKVPAPSVDLRKNMPNRLEVVVRGNHIIIFINGAYVTDVVDSSFKRGSSHFFVWLPEGNERATLTYDNLELRVPTP